MSQRALLFDLDGTLLDSAPAFMTAMDAYADQVGLPRLTKHREHYASAGARAAVAAIHSIDRDHPQFQQFREEFLALFLDTPVSLNQWYPGVKTLLTQLTDQQIPWGIVTNKPRPHTLAVLEVLLPQQPPALVCQGDLDTIKPDPAMLWAASDALNVDPADCLYAGDHERDIQAAKAAGMRSLACTYGYLHVDDDPKQWQADDLAETAHQLTEKALQWLTPTLQPN
ncbi:HAD family hydrolase [Saccharospirillum mangrovi]|uniref:HAD family hydrolase n=1 Tax=Saccharospirillum mangrovi TaxID=2161747 RepID=UPI000D398D00|nr:HAD-IA family hydrolase [Saccharospirillum mangrovi]